MEENISKTVFKDVVCLIGSIVSILVSSIWYLSLTLSICSLIYAIKSIKNRGNVLAKITTIFAIIGMTLCLMIYISAFMIATVSWFSM